MKVLRRNDSQKTASESVKLLQTRLHKFGANFERSRYLVLQPVVAPPIFNNDAADRVMRRKGSGPGRIPTDSVINKSSVINLTNGESRERAKPHGPGGIPTDIKVNGSVVINKATDEERGRRKPKEPAEHLPQSFKIANQLKKSLIYFRNFRLN
jgi:hypothetical protein